MTTTYRFQGKLILPEDEGWRSYRRDRDVLVLGPTPDGLFQSVLRELFRAFSEGMDEETGALVSFGLMLNVIQALPEEGRKSFIAAIAQGLVTEIKPVNGSLVGDMKQRASTIDLDTGDRRTPGGLYIPGEVALN